MCDEGCAAGWAGMFCEEGILNCYTCVKIIYHNLKKITKVYIKIYMR